MDQTFFRALSCYYRLEQGKSGWNRRELLKEGKHGNDRSSHDDISLTRTLLSAGGPQVSTFSPGADQRVDSLNFPISSAKSEVLYHVF